WLLYRFGLAVRRELRGRVDRLAVSTLVRDDIRDGRDRHDKLKTEFALQALDHNLKVQHAEEPAPKAASEHARGLLLKRKRGIGETQALERLPQLGQVILALRIDRCPDHRPRPLKAGEPFRASLIRDDGIA